MALGPIFNSRKTPTGISMRVIANILWLLYAGGIAVVPCYADDGNTAALDSEATIPSAIYRDGRTSLQCVSGVLFSPWDFVSRTEVMDYAQTNIRIGRMLNSPSNADSFLRGNLEALLELTNSIIYKGAGTYMGGITALIRYNFVQQDAKVIPYLQGGIGIIYTDAYQDSESGIGQAFEFTPQVSLGLRCLLDNSWSIDAEAMFHHISNANLANRNRGINAVGGFVGFTYYYD